jgi:hypothetical protein
VDVEVAFVTNRILDEDIPVVFDPDRGSEACVRMDDGWVRVFLAMGPFAEWGPCTMIGLDVGDGARLYDLATDPGPPATGNPGLLQFGNDYQATSSGTWSFSTINQASVGTVDVVSLPVDGETQLEFAAQGAIAGSDGWEFDFHVSATVLAQ